MATNSTTKKPKIARKKPDLRTLTTPQADDLVRRYARMKNISAPEARNQLIASGWRRLSALWRFANAQRAS